MSDQEFVAEFGSTENIRFLPPLSVKIYDAAGMEVKDKCKCGKEATTFIFGKEARMGLCNECMGY